MSPSTSALRAAIADLYLQLGAPAWAAPNLDGLADVLRDLSWLPDGDVVIGEPALGKPTSAALAGEADANRLRAVLEQAVRENDHGPHPIVLEQRP